MSPTEALICFVRRSLRYHVLSVKKAAAAFSTSHPTHPGLALRMNYYNSVQYKASCKASLFVTTIELVLFYVLSFP